MNSSQSLFDIPWVEKHRPTTLKSIVGNDSIITSLINISNIGNLPNLILSGPPGIGKTTSIMALAKTLLGDNFKKATLELNASDDRGINVVREKIKNFAMQKIPLPPNLHKIVILDEADNMTPSAQSSLRVIISDYGSTTRFCFACNDSSKIIEPIQSRCSIIRFSKLKSEEIKNRLIQVLNEENVNYDDDGVDSIVETSNGDMRYALNNAQSTFVGFGFINRENVYKIVDVPKPEIINRVVKLCFDGKFNECCSVVDGLINEGYSFLDILMVMNRVVQDMKDVDDKKRFLMLKVIAIYKMRCLEGINSRCQVYSFLGEVFKIGQE